VALLLLLVVVAGCCSRVWLQGKATVMTLEAACAEQFARRVRQEVTRTVSHADDGLTRSDDAGASAVVEADQVKCRRSGYRQACCTLPP
jgi:hypothetical protein